MLFIIIAGAIIITGVVLLFYRASRQESRPTALQKLGESVDLVFHEKDNTILDRLKFFKIYDATTLQAAGYNVLHSKSGHPDIWIFDYHARVGLWDKAMRPVQTVCFFNDPHLKLPGFRMFPSTTDFGRQGEAVFKYRPIVFPSRPQFAARYKLVGPKEHEIRELFKDDLITYFEKSGGICVEGYGNELLLYHHRKIMAPPEYRRFYQTARSLFRLFLHRGGTGTAEKTEMADNSRE
jgi:hypothetical protein